MAKKSAALIAAEAKIAALEARLVIARDVYRAQRAQIAELEAQLNTRGTKVVAVKPQPKAVPQPVVTHFVRRDGVRCEKVRVGNRAVTRELPRGVEAAEISMAAFEAAA